MFNKHSTTCRGILSVSECATAEPRSSPSSCEINKHANATKPRISSFLFARIPIRFVQICEEKIKIIVQIGSCCGEWKHMHYGSLLAEVQRDISNTVYCSYGFAFLFILYTDLYRCVLLEISVLFIYRRSVTFILQFFIYGE